MKRTYIDADVIGHLKKRAEQSSYRALAAEINVDFSFVYRVVKGTEKLSESMAQAAGFKLVPQPKRKWTRS